MNLPTNRPLVKVTVEKPSRTGDGAGGKAITYAAIPGNWYASQSLHNYSSLARLEQGLHNSAGPGAESKTLQLFVFEPPYPPGVMREWRIGTPDGTKWRVLFTRPYAGNLQVDTELVA